MKDVGAVFALIVGLLIITVFFVSYPELQQGQPLGSKGTIKTVGVSVWQDMNLTTPLTFIDWGFLSPSENKMVTCFLQNEGNVPSNLSLRTENWQPENASNWLSLSWNLNDATLTNEPLETQLTLTVSPDIKNITTFSFDIIIQAHA